MRPQAVKNIEKDILEPSFRYLVQKGLENTSVWDLCHAMNISYGSIYYWFDGKDDIYISVVRYGTQKVAEALFRFVRETITQPEIFPATFLHEADKYKAELRLIFQFATSPVYGERMREKALDFKSVYDEAAAAIAESIGIEREAMRSIIYMLISILVDYIIWEDREVSEMQMHFLYKMITRKYLDKNVAK